MAHPECPEPVRKLADRLLSTGQMCAFARETDSTEFIVATEKGILYRLRDENPQKRFYAPSPRAVCPNMKKISLEKILWALQDLTYRVRVEEPVCGRARRAIEAMLERS
jgi:quinolinate synthase